LQEQWQTCAPARSFGGDGWLSHSAAALTMRAMENDPISVRIASDESHG
jgi:hypothetical protein